MNNLNESIKNLLKHRHTVLCLGKRTELDFTNQLWLPLFQKLSHKDSLLKKSIPEQGRLIVYPTPFIEEDYVVKDDFKFGITGEETSIVIFVKSDHFLLNQCCFIFQKTNDWSIDDDGFYFLRAIDCCHILCLQFYPFLEGDSKRNGLNESLLNLQNQCIVNDYTLSIAIMGGFRRFGADENETEEEAMNLAKENYNLNQLHASCFANCSFTTNDLIKLLDNSNSITAIIQAKKKEVEEIIHRLNEFDLEELLTINIFPVDRFSKKLDQLIKEETLAVLQTPMYRYPQDFLPKDFDQIFTLYAHTEFLKKDWEELCKDIAHRIKQNLLIHLNQLLSN